MTVLLGVRLTGRRVVVAGGGPVAAAKCAALLADGARVQVVAPELGVDLARRVEAGEVAWTPRPVEADDLDDAWMVIAATANAAADEWVCAEAIARRILCVCTSRAAFGTAVTPATGTHDGLLVGVLSAGAPDPRRVVAVRNLLLRSLNAGAMQLEGHRRRRSTQRRTAGAVAS